MCFSQISCYHQCLANLKFALRSTLNERCSAVAAESSIHKHLYSISVTNLPIEINFEMNSCLSYLRLSFESCMFYVWNCRACRSGLLQLNKIPNIMSVSGLMVISFLVLVCIFTNILVTECATRIFTLDFGNFVLICTPKIPEIPNIRTMKKIHQRSRLKMAILMR